MTRKICYPCRRGLELNIVPMEDQEALRRKLADLESEHRDLDDVIARMTDGPSVDQLQVQRLKKRKLLLKDEISRVRSKLVPDIIA